MAGDVIGYTNRRNQTAQFTYDQFGRVLTTTADGQTTTWNYSPVGAWVAVSNAESTDTLNLDSKLRETSAVMIRTGTRYIVSTTYNNEGLRNGMKVERVGTGGWTRDFAFGYDLQKHLNYFRGFTGDGTSITYTSEHLPHETTVPTGANPSQRLKETRSYTAAHLLSTLAFNQSAVQLVLGRSYAYDGLNRVGTITKGGTEDYATRALHYDLPGRLSKYEDVHHWQEQGPFICPDPFDLTTCYFETIYHADTIRNEVFTYDSAGNRTDHSAVIQNGNRLTSFDGYTLTYDDDGNLLSKVKAGVWNQTFTWNTMGQLTQAVTNGVTSSFGYDGWGRRVRKTTGSTIMRYLHDGDDLVAEIDASGNAVREYAYYPGIDRPHSMRRASDGAVFYYLMEQPGHVNGLVNSSNQVVNKYDYTPWGETISTVEAVAQPLRFTAREWDSELALYYLRARFYDPKLGRFLSQDPIGLAGGINPYTYGSNDPANTTDPLGLDDNPCPSGSQLIGVALNAVYNGKKGVGYECQTDDGEVFWVFASNEYLDAAMQMDPVTIEADPWCHFCAWQNPSERDSRIGEMMNTLNTSAGVTTFTMSGIPVTLLEAPSLEPDGSALQAVCSDAIHTTRAGNFKFAGGAGTAAMSLFFFRMPRRYKGPPPGPIGMHYAWEYMQDGTTLVVLGYAVYEALGCSGVSR